MSTIIQSGSFTSTGEEKFISVRSGIDIFETVNITQSTTIQTPGRAISAYWQRGIPIDNFGISTEKLDGIDTTEVKATITGFTLFDSGTQTLGPAAALTAISADAAPVITTASTVSLLDGTVVRLFNIVGAQQLGGYDFSVDVLTGTTFSLPYMQAIVAGTNGFFAKVNNDPKFYPRSRLITQIGLADPSSVTITMSVKHDFTVGQEVRFKIPAAFGTVQLDGLSGVITDINISPIFNIITVAIPSTGFTPFVFPLTGAVPFTPAQVIPVGEAAQEPFANLLDDATEDRAQTGMLLAGGITGPAGSAGDLIFWKATKAFSYIVG